MFAKYTFSQTNYIYNPDFEAMDPGANPTTQGAVDDLQSWETRTKLVEYGTQDYFLHSPDLYTANYSPAAAGGLNQLTFNVTPPTPHSGANMVGMLPYELIQQRFNNQAMDDGELYTLSMYIWLPDNDPTWFQSHALDVFLAKNRVEYKKENGEICQQDYVDYNIDNVLNLNERFDIGQKNLNLTSFPTDQWHRVSFTFKAPNNIQASWDWLVIDVKKTNYQDNCQTDPCDACFGAYLFIDDVSLQKADYCNALCSPPRFMQGPINFTGRSVNDQIISSCYPWYIPVQNAIGIQLEVYNRWGELIHEQNALDVNVLKDVGYNDYLFAWLGEASNGNYIYDGSYPFKLHIWNCNHNLEIVGDMTNVYGGCSGSVQGEDIVNPELNDCCPRVIYIQNKIYSGPQLMPKIGADERIFAGSNVNPGSPNGPVIVQAGVTLKYIAGIEVRLEPGFSAAPARKSCHPMQIYTRFLNL